MYCLDGRDPKLREEFPECLIGVKETICDPRPDGTTRGMHAVDGYYRISDNEASIREIKIYDVKTAEEAHERAKKDGLIKGIMIEFFFSEIQPGVLKSLNLQDLLNKSSL